MSETSGGDAGVDASGDADQSGAGTAGRVETESTDPGSGVEYVLVTEYFHPDTASTGQLMTDLAVGLRDRGLDLRVFTGQPNYHSGDHERQPRRSVHEGVPVRRIAAPQFRQTSLPRRLFNWAVFTAWMTVVLLASSPPADRDRELLFVSNPPVLPVAMWLVSRVRGWEYTYVVYDLYPDQPVELGYLSRGGPLTRLWAWANGRALCGARSVVALGPVMADRVAQRAGEGLSAEDVEVVHNWADGEFIEPIAPEDNDFRRDQGLLDAFTVLYSGNVGEFHDLETLVRAAARFDPGEVQVVIIGDGDARESVVSLAESLGVRGETVRFLPFQPYERLPETLTAGDVSVVTVEEGFEGVCVSSKLYSSLAAGRPVLGIVHPRGDEARVIREHDAGVCVRQGDVDGVVEAVERWRSDPDLRERQGRNARAAFEERFTREQSVDRYYEVLAGDG